MPPSSLQNASTLFYLQVTCTTSFSPQAEVLIRAAPDELPHYAPELARCLLHCRVPECVDVEEGSPANGLPAEQRLSSMVALLAAAPDKAGEALLPEVFSPHVDIFQRLLALDTLSAAAQVGYC